MLSQLGANSEIDERIKHACAYFLDHVLADGGHFSSTGSPGGTVDCLQGNMIAALIDLGCDDPRLEKALEWMARSEKGKGIDDKGEANAAKVPCSGGRGIAGHYGDEQADDDGPSK